MPNPKQAGGYIQPVPQSQYIRTITPAEEMAMAYDAGRLPPAGATQRFAEAAGRQAGSVLSGLLDGRERDADGVMRMRRPMYPQ